MPLLELEEIGLRGRVQGRSVGPLELRPSLLRFPVPLHPILLVVVSEGGGEVARAEGEAEVALGSSALARAGEEKDADAGAAATFSSSSSAAMGAGETMLVFSPWVERRGFFWTSSSSSS